MESGMNWEQNTLINELTQGMELAKQLKLHLAAESSAESREFLVQNILSSYDKALLILNWSGSVGQSQPLPPTFGVPESPASIDGSPRSDVFDRGLKEPQQYQNDVSKKRKMMPRWTGQVRISSENGLEGPHDDGYSWRKYGQKDILGCIYPRSYYRCTYRNIKDCWATKQVQRSDEDPTIFDITYRGTHTCTQGNQSNPQPAALETKEAKENKQENNHKQNQSNEILMSFKNGLKVNTEDLDNNEIKSPLQFPSTSVLGIMKGENHIFSPSTLINNNPLGGFSQTFISPATSESTYFSVSPSPCQMSNFTGVPMVQQHTEYDFTDIVSANTSATSSPILDFDFSLDKVDFDPNFPFGNPGFFS